MKWLFLAGGLLFETLGYIGLKYSLGLTSTMPVIAAVGADLLALVCFVLALRHFETGFVYIVGAGMGTALIALTNAVVFRQPLNWIQIGSIMLVIAGSVGLHSQGNTH